MNVFFDKVDNRLPLNFDSYIKKFNKKNIDISKMFYAEIVKKPFYVLTAKNYMEYKELKEKFYIEADKNTRIGAAKLGDSHKAKVSYSFLLFKKDINSKVETLFFADNKIQSQDFIDIKKKVIIIENLENFGNTINNFKNIDINLNEYSYIYGSGKSILNSSFNNLFENCAEILCLFDIDFDGMEMFDLLNEKFNNTHFIFPKNISQYLNKSIKTISKEELFRLNNRFYKNAKLNEILNEINKINKYVEQELYLEEN